MSYHIPHALIFLAGIGIATAGIFALLFLVAAAGHTERMFDEASRHAAPDKCDAAEEAGP